MMTPLSRILLIAFSLAFFGVTGAWAAGANLFADAPAYKLATIEGKDITLRDIREIFLLVHGGHASMLAGEGGLADFLNSVIEKRILAHEGLLMEIDRRPEIKRPIDARIRELTTRTWYDENIKGSTTVTAADVNAAHPYLSQRWHLRLILVPSKEEADRVLNEAHGGTLKDLVKENSYDISAPKGGEMRNVAWGVLDPAIDNALLNVKEGDVIGPLKTNFGWALVEAVGVAPVENLGGYTPAKVRAVLENRKIEVLLQSKIDSWKKKASIRYNPGAVGVEGWLKIAAAESLVTRWDVNLPLAEVEGVAIALKDLNIPEHIVSGFTGFPKGLCYFVSQSLQSLVVRTLTDQEVEREGLAERTDIAAKIAAYRDDLVVTTLSKEVFEDIPQPEDAALKEYFTAHTDKYQVPEKRQGSVFTCKDSTAGRTAATALTGGKSLEEVRKEFLDEAPDNPHRDSFFHVWFSKGELTPALEPAAFSLQEGTAMVVPDRQEVVVFIEKIQPQKPLSFEEAKSDIQKDYRKDSIKQKKAEWLEKLRKANRVKIYPETVAKAQKYLEEALKATMNKEGVKPPAEGERHS